MWWNGQCISETSLLPGLSGNAHDINTGKGARLSLPTPLTRHYNSPKDPFTTRDRNDSSAAWIIIRQRTRYKHQDSKLNECQSMIFLFINCVCTMILFFSFLTLVLENVTKYISENSSAWKMKWLALFDEPTICVPPKCYFFFILPHRPINKSL